MIAKYLHRIASTKKAIIGVYYGRNGFNTQTSSKYAVLMIHSVVDPQPKADNLSTIPFGMGMHHNKFTQIPQSANVVLNKFLCFMTTKK
jgi:hypothetical protein